MLEKLPSALGRALRGVRSDLASIVYNDASLAQVPSSLIIESEAFADGAPLPARYTADAEGLSPPLRWRDGPPHAAELVLLVEDPDAPMPHPLVHAIVWGLRGGRGAIAEGALSGAGQRAASAPLGRNSLLTHRYLPPDPPAGHGVHRYAFQLFALDSPVHFEKPPGRGVVLECLRRHAIARGLLIGSYQRP